MNKSTQPKQFSLQRLYSASVQEVWDLWTTRDGIESWWGPEGFTVTVTSIDLRPGGALTYLMTATDPPQVEFMRQHGLPLSTPCKVTYLDVSVFSRLVYTTLTDFIPGVSPYEVTTVVEFQESAAGMKLIITSDVMHDETWTARAREGHQSQLRKLDALVSGRARR